MSSFIPLYLRTHYQDDPMFKNTKTVFTVYNNGYSQELPLDYMDKVRVDGIGDKELDNYNENNYVGVIKGGIALSDVVTKGHPTVDEKIEEYIEEVQSEKIYFDTNDKESFVEGYNKLYTDIVS